MKKTLSIILLLILSLFLFSCSSSESKENNVHVHSFGYEWQTDEFNHWQVCTTCGQRANYNSHEWVIDKYIVNPTCSKEGSASVKCKYCGYKYADTIKLSKSEHQFDNQYICQNCGFKAFNFKCDYEFPLRLLCSYKDVTGKRHDNALYVTDYKIVYSLKIDKTGIYQIYVQVYYEIISCKSGNIVLVFQAISDDGKIFNCKTNITGAAGQQGSVKIEIPYSKLELESLPKDESYNFTLKFLNNILV